MNSAAQCERCVSVAAYCVNWTMSSCCVCSLAVVGEKEKMTNSVNVRTRDNKIHGELLAAEVLARLTLLKQSRCRNAEEEF